MDAPLIESEEPVSMQDCELMRGLLKQLVLDMWVATGITEQKALRTVRNLADFSLQEKYGTSSH